MAAYRIIKKKKKTILETDFSNRKDEYGLVLADQAQVETTCPLGC